MQRRKLSSITAALLMVVPLQAFAAWPDGKTVEVIVPAPPGNNTGDPIARLVVERLAKRLNTSMVILNKPGAGGNIGAGAAAAAKPDGYTLLFSWAGTLAVNPNLYAKLPFDTQKSFDPIGLVAEVPNILVVNKQVPASDFASFVRLLKTKPGTVNYGSTGKGSSMHLAAELFMRETGTDMVHVPYSSGQATTNLISNEIQAMFQLVPGVVAQVRSGHLKPLAIMSATRSAALPEVPTTEEVGAPQLVSSTWFAFLAPRGTPANILDRVNTELNQVLADPELREKLGEMGATPLGGTRRDLADHMVAETTKWGRIIKEKGIEGR